MTPVGHILVGASLGTLVIPPKTNIIRRISLFFLFVFLALLPDLPLPGWGHQRYLVSHSIWVNLFIILLFLGIIYCFRRVTKHTNLNGWFLFFCILAIFSHLLLDSFYNHGYGIMIFWPFSERSLVLPIPWLSVGHDFSFPPNLEMLKIWFFEFITFGPLLLVSIWIRKLFNPR